MCGKQRWLAAGKPAHSTNLDTGKPRIVPGQERPGLSRHENFVYSLFQKWWKGLAKTNPQRLKPRELPILRGTTEVVPFQGWFLKHALDVVSH